MPTAKFLTIVWCSAIQWSSVHSNQGWENSVVSCWCSWTYCWRRNLDRLSESTSVWTLSSTSEEEEWTRTEPAEESGRRSGQSSAFGEASSSRRAAKTGARSFRNTLLISLCNRLTWREIKLTILKDNNRKHRLYQILTKLHGCNYKDTECNYQMNSVNYVTFRFNRTSQMLVHQDDSIILWRLLYIILLPFLAQN